VGRVLELLDERPYTKAQLVKATNAQPAQVKHAIDRLRRDNKLFLLAASRRWALEDFDDCPTCRGRGWVYESASPRWPPNDVSFVEIVGARKRKKEQVNAVVVDPAVRASRLCVACDGKGWVKS
jgi:hypothetical protein